MGIREVEWGMDWINLVHDRERWWAVANAVINI
jgi:hypothetical protein